MAIFTAGSLLSAQLLNDAFPPSAADTQNTVGTTLSTTYTATLTGGVAAGVAFVAPTSGNVVIHWGAVILNSTTQSTYAAPQVRTGNVVGSGTVVFTVTDDSSLSITGTGIGNRWGASLYISGLTAGADYNVQMLHRVTGGTGTTSRKHIVVVPSS